MAYMWERAFRYGVVKVLFLLVLCLSILTSVEAAVKKQSAATASNMLLLLPPSIFEETYAPIDEEEKELLLETGRSTHWTVTVSREDLIQMYSNGEDPSWVTVQLLHASGPSLVVVGSRTKDGCSAEVWSYSPSRGLLPHPLPENPELSDFFVKEPKLAPDVSPTYALCLDGTYLEAQVSFWNEAGALSIKPDNRVFFSWNGKRFVKEIAKGNPDPLRPAVEVRVDSLPLEDKGVPVDGVGVPGEGFKLPGDTPGPSGV